MHESITDPLELQKEGLKRIERQTPEIKFDLNQFGNTLTWFAVSHANQQSIIISHTEIINGLLSRVEKLEREVQQLADERTEQILRSIDYSV